MPEQVNPYAHFLPMIDVNDALKRVMGKKELLFSLLNRYKMRPMVEDLAAQINADNPDAIKESAHALKGSAANLSMLSLRDIAIEIEQNTKAGLSSTDRLDALFETLDAVERAVSELLQTAGA